ncbi:hypothetical protein VTN49DRAFT_5344 [Thermomyces lanuginosus]|uniref:uncharacterized protein n=1 Tax=Thermomyces lanuginosus TaxID=5541 RepID=UPI003742D604
MSGRHRNMRLRPLPQSGQWLQPGTARSAGGLVSRVGDRQKGRVLTDKQSAEQRDRARQSELRLGPAGVTGSGTKAATRLCVAVAAPSVEESSLGGRTACYSCNRRRSARMSRPATGSRSPVNHTPELGERTEARKRGPGRYRERMGSGDRGALTGTAGLFFFPETAEMSVIGRGRRQEWNRRRQECQPVRGWRKG